MNKKETNISNRLDIDDRIKEINEDINKLKLNEIYTDEYINEEIKKYRDEIIELYESNGIIVTSDSFTKEIESWQEKLNACKNINEIIKCTDKIIRSYKRSNIYSTSAINNRVSLLKQFKKEAINKDRFKSIELA